MRMYVVAGLYIFDLLEPVGVSEWPVSDGRFSVDDSPYASDVHGSFLSVNS